MKHPSGWGEYLFERNVTRTLSKYPHFVKLLGYDDECQTLYMANFGPELGRLKNKRSNPNLNETSIRKQLDYIFAVLDLEQLTPSGEIFMGKNNIHVDTSGFITFFDFNQSRAERKLNPTRRRRLHGSAQVPRGVAV